MNSQKKFKIAIIRPGIHTINEQFCYFLARNGLDVTLVAPENSIATPNKINNPNFRVKFLKTVNFGKFVDFPITIGLYRYLKKEDFDIIQSNEDFQFVTWISALYSKMNKKKFFVIEEKYTYPRFRIHRILFRIFRKLFCQFVWRTAEKIICHSRASLSFMQNSIKGEKIKKKLLFLPIGVNTNIFYPINVKKENFDLRIISVGRLIDHKDYPTLIKAVSYLIKQKNINIKLTIIGRGLLKSSLSKMIKNLDLNNNVFIIDRVPFQEINKYYSENEIFILPSVRESVGAVVLETMACGLPVILSNVGGMTDFVKNGKNGYIFKAGDYKDLAGKILKLMNKQKRNKFGNESLRLAKEKFDWSILIKKYIKIFADNTSNVGIVKNQSSRINYYEENLDINYSDHTHKRRLRVMKFYSQKVHGKVLDLGCGAGKITSLFRGEVIGCDISENALKIARENSPGHIFIKANAQRLPFSDSYFDFIIATDIFEHIPNAQQAINESYRVLKRGGKLITIIPNGQGISQTYDRRNIKNNPYHHVSFFSQQDIKNYFSIFKVISWENLTVFPCSPKWFRILLSGGGLFYFLDFLLCKLPLRFGEEWVIELEKANMIKN